MIGLPISARLKLQVTTTEHVGGVDGPPEHEAETLHEPPATMNGESGMCGLNGPGPPVAGAACTAVAKLIAATAAVPKRTFLVMSYLVKASHSGSPYRWTFCDALGCRQR